MTDINQTYFNLLQQTLLHGRQSVNARTKHGVRTAVGAQFVKVHLDAGKLPIPGNRRYFPHIAAAEAAWQTLGTRDADFIMRYAPKLWGKFLVDGQVPAAYGYRWSDSFGRNQIELAIDALMNDPTSRHVYVSTWDPRCDGLGEPNQPPNIPCLVGFALNVIDDALHMSVMVRSSDLFVGLPYDIMCYAFTLDMLAAELNLKPGTLSFMLANAHLYETHWTMTEACVSERVASLSGYELKKYADSIKADTAWVTKLHRWAPNASIEPQLPAWSWSEVKAKPHGYIEHVKRLGLRVYSPNWHCWNPLPEVVV